MCNDAANCNELVFTNTLRLDKNILACLLALENIEHIFLEIRKLLGEKKRDSKSNALKSSVAYLLTVYREE